MGVVFDELGAEMGVGGPYTDFLLRHYSRAGPLIERLLGAIPASLLD